MSDVLDTLRNRIEHHNFCDLWVKIGHQAEWIDNRDTVETYLQNHIPNMANVTEFDIQC